MRNIKIVSIIELTIVILSVVAFSYFVSTNLPEVLKNPSESKFIQFLTKPLFPSVSASPILPSGCCKETLGGAICQDMLIQDTFACKTDLVGTGCQVVKECQTGCCYDADSGMCTLNAPQEKCTENGGKWDASKTCEIPECQVGCCVLGSGASMMTTRECTQTSNQYRITKDFRPLDSLGSCDAYSDLSAEGACLSDAGDFSGEKNCIFTTKDKCLINGNEFKRGYLCTSTELNTVCVKTKETNCFGDGVYFIDSCKNKANIYDSTKTDVQSYWEKVIPATQSCTGNPATCGNCDYKTGSICTKYYSGKDMTKPSLGDYSCRNLNCANGKDHGESWCISDSNSSAAASSPVGSRSYVAKCFEGEIILEGCADFNQEVCIQNTDNSSKYSEAKCEINDWRACISANDKEQYSEIEHACDLLPQCIMFTDIPGNQIYKNLPGFKEVSNADQGSAGSIGRDANKIITHCVPKHTPGYQFWTATSVSNPFSQTTGTNLASSASYGGSKEETNAICSLGSFTCVSHIQIDTPLVSPDPKDKENPECNINAVDQSKQKVELMMEAMNERCRSIGSCGMQYNTQGQLGEAGFSVSRVFINKDGETIDNYPTDGYKFSDAYLKTNLKKTQTANAMGNIKTLIQLSTINSGAVALYGIASLLTGHAVEQSVIQQAQGASAQDIVKQGEINTQVQQIEGGIGALAGAGLLVGVGATTPVYTAVAIVGTETVSATGSTAVAATQALQQTLSATGQAGNVVGSPVVGLTNPSTMTSLGASLGVALVTTACAILGSYIGGMIAKSTGMSPGETTAFVGMMSATFSGAAAGAIMLWGPEIGLKVCAASGGNPVICGIAILVAVIMLIYSAFTGEDNEYYIVNFKCEAWEPPATGKCEECNNDVRPCSEYKCRSLGNNCHYFVDNGEPGYCASLDDVWSALITPWNQTLTSGNKYSNVTSFGFKIINEKNPGKSVDAWKSLTFGIITDKQAICKLDLNHSASFDSMQYTMLSDKDYTTGKVDGMHHKITVSPHILIGESELDQGMTTPPIKEGDNEYYIKCQNFAGQENEAPFVVQVKQNSGPDLTAAGVTRFSPAEKAYIAYGANSTQIWMYVTEPAECRYSIEYDQTYFNDMQNNFSCITNPEQGFYGEWPCIAYLNDVTENTNLFIKCKDQPELNETDLVVRNTNSISVKYPIEVCKTGLSIIDIDPSDTVILNETRQIDLEVTTSGCIEGGKAVCYYKLPEYGSQYSMFLQTGNTIHKQPLTTLANGIHPLDIRCQDAAGNSVNLSTNITVLIDNDAPKITRAFVDSGNLVIKTNEEASCLFVKNNVSLGCDFIFENTNSQYFTTHTIKINENGGDIFYIKCADRFGNLPLSGCTQILRLNDMQ